MKYFDACVDNRKQSDPYCYLELLLSQDQRNCILKSKVSILSLIHFYENICFCDIFFKPLNLIFSNHFIRLHLVIVTQHNIGLTFLITILSSTLYWVFLSSFGWDYSGFSFLREIHFLLQSFMIRRTKNEVIIHWQNVFEKNYIWHYLCQGSHWITSEEKIACFHFCSSEIPFNNPKGKRDGKRNKEKETFLNFLKNIFQIQKSKGKLHESDISVDDFLDERFFSFISLFLSIHSEYLLRFSVNAMVLNLFQLTGTAKIPSICEWISDRLGLHKVWFF